MKLNLIYGLVMAPLTAISVLTTAPKADASQLCTWDSGLHFCFESIAPSPGGHDVFNVKGNGLGRYVEERMEVQCSGVQVTSWQSYGHMSEIEAQAIVTNFCQGRGTTGRGY